MTNEVFEKIMRGLLDAIDHVNGKDVGAIVHHVKPLDVRAIRESLGMERWEFAMVVGVTRETLGRWERGERRPKGPALMLLKVLKKEPEAVLRAMGYKDFDVSNIHHSK